MNTKTHSTFAPSVLNHFTTFISFFLFLIPALFFFLSCIFTPFSSLLLSSSYFLPLLFPPHHFSLSLSPPSLLFRLCLFQLTIFIPLSIFYYVLFSFLPFMLTPFSSLLVASFFLFTSFPPPSFLGPSHLQTPHVLLALHPCLCHLSLSTSFSPPPSTSSLRLSLFVLTHGGTRRMSGDEGCRN